MSDDELVALLVEAIGAEAVTSGSVAAAFAPISAARLSAPSRWES